MEEHKKPKCRVCRDYWPRKGFSECSKCLALADFRAGTVTIDNGAARAHVPGYFGQEYVQRFCRELVSFSISQTRYRFVSESRLRILLLVLRDRSAYGVYVTLLGYAEFPACALSAEQADALLAVLLDKSTDHTTQCLYIHAVGPFVYDYWNLKCNHPVFVCYYKPEHPPRSVPEFQAGLFYTQCRPYSMTMVRVGGSAENKAHDPDCTVCMEGVDTSSMSSFFCVRCSVVLHQHCLASLRRPVCPVCRADFREQVHTC